MTNARLILQDPQAPSRVICTTLEGDDSAISRWVYSQVLTYARDHRLLPGLVNYILTKE